MITQRRHNYIINDIKRFRFTSYDKTTIVNLWTSLHVFYIMMLCFHFLDKFVVHINVSIARFSMTSLMGDMAALFFSLLQYRPSVKHKSPAEITASNFFDPYQPLGITLPIGL